MPSSTPWPRTPAPWGGRSESRSKGAFESRRAAAHRGSRRRSPTAALVLMPVACLASCTAWTAPAGDGVEPRDAAAEERRPEAAADQEPALEAEAEAALPEGRVCAGDLADSLLRGRPLRVVQGAGQRVRVASECPTATASMASAASTPAARCARRAAARDPARPWRPERRARRPTPRPRRATVKAAAARLGAIRATSTATATPATGARRPSAWATAAFAGSCAAYSIGERRPRVLDSASGQSSSRSVNRRSPRAGPWSRPAQRAP
jgi:hypothetical protein